MCLKKLCIFASVLIALSIATSSFARPPVGAFDETYYDGIWNIQISETCHRASDGRVVNIPLQDLYMILYFQQPYYYGYLYPTIQDARLGTNEMGYVQLDFNPGIGLFNYLPIPVPPQPVSYVVNGAVYRGVNSTKIMGCEGILQAWLYTVVKTNSDKHYNKLTGTGIEVCADPEQQFYQCDTDWIARWSENLPGPI